MAGITKKGDVYYCDFRHGGKRHYFTVGKVTDREAIAKAAEVDETLRLLTRGRIQIPDDVELRDCKRRSRSAALAD